MYSERQKKQKRFDDILNIIIIILGLGNMAISAYQGYKYFKGG